MRCLLDREAYGLFSLFPTGESGNFPNANANAVELLEFDDSLNTVNTYSLPAQEEELEWAQKRIIIYEDLTGLLLFTFIDPQNGEFQLSLRKVAFIADP